MNSRPLWRRVRQCALELTEAGQTPFTRSDLIECVRRSVPGCSADSINPTIQGITDNLKGGAPGAIGKRLLHSVGRGKFVLRDAEHEAPGDSRQGESTAKAEVEESGQLPTSENDLRDGLVDWLRGNLEAAYAIESEGRLSYKLPTGDELSHASDILVSKPDRGRYVSVEVKYRSATTDQFKCRSYDAMHMKQHYGQSVLTIMVFAKTRSGVSIEQARRICYSFDRFYGAPAEEVVLRGEPRLLEDIRRFL